MKPVFFATPREFRAWLDACGATGYGVIDPAPCAAVAFVVERTDSPWRGPFHGLALLSFALPGLLTTMAWMLILSPNIGWVNGILKSLFGLGESPLNIYTMGGMIWALSSHYFPLAYLLMGPAFRVLDTRMEEAAVVSGARSWQIAGRITLPLLRPAILSTLLLLFVRGIESFEVPRLVGMQQAQEWVMAAELFGAEARVSLFGSRTDDRLKGGDIDLLVELPRRQADARRKSLTLAARLQQVLGDQPIDVLVVDPDTPIQPIHEIARRSGMPI